VSRHRGKSPRFRLGTVLPVAGLAGLGIALAIGTGKVGWVIQSLPFTETPNGFSLFCLLILVAGCWWRLRSIDTPAHPSLEMLLDLDDLMSLSELADLVTGRRPEIAHDDLALSRYATA
jgi:hypothetical protein